MKTYLLLFYFVVFFFEVSAQDYYVSTSGSDNNPGTMASPWRTFQKACDSATPGSTVYMRGGQYQSAYLNVSGTPSQVITFTNFNNEIVTIDGGSTNTQVELLFIDNQHHVRVEGLRFANAMGNYAAGIYITNGSHHISLVNNHISQINFSTNPNDPIDPSKSCFPIIVYNEHPTNACMSIIIEGNEVADCRTGYAEAVALIGNVDGFVVRNNYVHDITNIGIDIIGGYGTSSNPSTDMARNGVVIGNEVHDCVSSYAVSAGIYVDGGHHIIVEQNSSHHNGRGYEIGAEEFGHQTQDVVLKNNIAYHNLEAGIAIGGYDYPNTGKVVDSEVRHNTCYENNTEDNYEGELLIEYTEGCSITHNIFSANNTDDLLLISRLSSQSLILDYNGYYLHGSQVSAALVDWNGTVSNYTTYQANTGQDARSIYAAPMFNLAQPGDFSLNISSPCIHAGDPSLILDSTERDYLSIDRTVGNVDLGAYEYAGVCQPIITLSQPISGRAFYHSDSELSASSLISGGSEVVMTAVDEVTLMPGFEVLISAEADIQTGPCPNP